MKGAVYIILSLLITGCSSLPKASSTVPSNEPWNPAELRKLANQGHPDFRRMMWLINRASAEKDDSFLDLLHRSDLMKRREIRMSLHGYEFAISGNPDALNKLIEEDRRDPRGGDSAGILVAGHLDEWNQTIDMIRSHEAKTDGAGSIALASFWENRRLYFPRQFQRHMHRK